MFGYCFSLRHRYRFLELYYRRAETTHKSGRVVPSRVETVILFLPDVWSCVPTRLEWDGLQLNYKKQLERKLLRAASNPDDMDAANETDEAAAADQKALPTSSHITFIPFYYIIIYFIYIDIRANRFFPLLNWIFNRLYLSIDPIDKLICFKYYILPSFLSCNKFYLSSIKKKNHNLGVLA